jgi:hypothetical protein
VDEGAASRNANDVLMLRAKLNSLGERAVITNKVVLEAEKARDELHNQIEQIEQRLHPKRARTHDAAGDAHEMLAEVENWDMRDHRHQVTRVQNRRNVEHSRFEYWFVSQVFLPSSCDLGLPFDWIH